MIKMLRVKVRAHPLVALILAVIIFAPAGGLAWWLGSPLFISQTVDEDFPELATATIPGNIAPADAQVVMETMAQITNPVEEPMPDMTIVQPAAAGLDGNLAGSIPAVTPAPDPVVLARGGFIDGDLFHRGDGIATIYDLGNGSRVLRFEEFEVTNGPDLRVLTSPNPNPFGHDDLVAAGYTELGQLKGNIGNQNYPLPPDLDIESIGSVIIYCKPFAVIFALAPITPA